MCGPCRFSHWDENGEPVGRQERAALVQVSAVTREQSGNTADMFPLLVTSKLKQAYGVKVLPEIVRASSGRQKIKVVTGNARAAEGKRITFALLNETQHWTQATGGLRMYETTEQNAAKLGNRYLAITNAYLPGEGSVAELMRKDYESFVAAGITGQMLYDSVEAKARAPIGGPLLPLVLERMIGDSKWSRIEDVVASIMKPSISPARSRRMWLNQVVADDDQLVTPAMWDPLLDPDLILKPGDEIVIGLDGGRSDDSTAIVAIRPADMAVFTLGMWEKPAGPDADGWLVDQEDVSDVIDMIFARYNVGGFFSDVAYWETYIVRWTEKYVNKLAVKATADSPIGLDMRGNQKKITLNHEALVKFILDGKLKHDGNFQLRTHVMNARRNENAWGVSFKKESRESPKKVDGYAALLLAYIAAIEFRLNAKKKPKRTGRSFWM